MKKPAKKAPLNSALAAMLNKWDAEDIFEALEDEIRELHPKREEKERELLADKAIEFFTTHKTGVKIIKTQSLAQEIELDEAINRIIPFYSDQQTQIFA